MHLNICSSVFKSFLSQQTEKPSRGTVPKHRGSVGSLPAAKNSKPSSLVLLGAQGGTQREFLFVKHLLRQAPLTQNTCSVKSRYLNGSQGAENSTTFETFNFKEQNTLWTGTVFARNFVLLGTRM